MSKVLKNIIFSLITIVLFFTLLNLLCWLIPGNYYNKLLYIDEQSSQTTYGYFQPNQSRDLMFPGLKPYHVTINSLGLRTTGEDVTAASLSLYKYRILTLGDSHTFGLFADDEESYPYILQQMFNQNSASAIVLNAGIGGATITDYNEYLTRKGLSLKPDAVVLNFCANDLADVAREQTMFEMAFEKSQIPFFKNLKNMKLVRTFMGFYINYKYGRWLSKVKDERAREILESDSTDMEDVLYAYNTYHVNEVMTDPFSENLKPQWDAYLKELNKTIQVLKENNIPLIVFFPSDLHAVMDLSKNNYYQYVKGLLMANAVEFIELAPEFAKYKSEILSFYVHPPRDFHLNQKGNVILAELVYEKLKALGM